MELVFKIIGFTSPSRWSDAGREASIICEYLNSSAIDIFHLRKMDKDEEYVKSLMQHIPSHLHRRIVLHSHFNLSDKYNFGGLHLKDESKELTKKYKFVTRSCHSLAELQRKDVNVAYSFLSPIYNSISKRGYGSAFNIHDLDMLKIKAASPVIALGGVTPEKFSEISHAKFAGAALLGYLWSPESTYKNKISEILETRSSLQ